ANPLASLADELLYNGQPIGFWLRALARRDAAARANAAHVLGEFFPPTPASTRALIAVLDDRVIDVRLAAIHALGLIGPEAANSASKLDGLLSTDSIRFDPGFARQAALALASVQPKGGGPLISVLLNDLPGTERSPLLPVVDRSPINVRALERLSGVIKDQQPA